MAFSVTVAPGEQEHFGDESSWTIKGGAIVIDDHEHSRRLAYAPGHWISVEEDVNYEVTVW